jgi:hypothetical protein
LTEYLASPLRDRTRTHRCQPSEVNSCSAARFSRSRSRARRCSHSDSLNLRVALAITAPSTRARPLRAVAAPNAPRTGAKIRRPARSGPGHRGSSHASCPQDQALPRATRPRLCRLLVPPNGQARGPSVSSESRISAQLRRVVEPTGRRSKRSRTSRRMSGRSNRETPLPTTASVSNPVAPVAQDSNQRVPDRAAVGDALMATAPQTPADRRGPHHPRRHRPPRRPARRRTRPQPGTRLSRGGSTRRPSPDRHAGRRLIALRVDG